VLSTNILNSLQRIERIMSTHQDEMALVPDLADPLIQLEMYVFCVLDAFSVFMGAIAGSYRPHSQNASGGGSVETDCQSTEGSSWIGRTERQRKGSSLDSNRT